MGEQERAMSPNEETKRLLESSETRRNRRVDTLLKDKSVKAAVCRDQRPKPKDARKPPEPKRAAGI
jgi:hypothetical protein